MPLIDDTRKNIYYYHRRFLPTGQRPFGLSDASPYLSKAGTGLAGAAAVTWTVAGIRLFYGCRKLSSMIGTGAGTHAIFFLLLFAFILMLSMVLNMEHAATADEKDKGCLNETLEQEEEQQTTPAEALLKAQNSLAEAKEEGAAGPWDVIVNHFERVCRTLQRAESLRLFEEDGLAILLGAEDEGAEAASPFFNKVVPSQMSKTEKWNASKGRYAVVPKPLAARMNTALSTPTSSVVGDDDRDRSESVLPRGAPSSSIYIDGAVVVVVAPKPKKMGKMAAFRAGWKRMFSSRKNSFSRRATAASSSCEMA